MTGKVTKKQKRRKLWSPADEEILLALWSEKIRDLRGNRRNREVYEEMSEEMEKYESYFSPSEITVKVHNLASKYKKEKDKNVAGIPSDWIHFQKVHAIIAGYSECKEELLIGENFEEQSVSYESDCKFEEVTTRQETSTPTMSDVPSSAGAEKVEEKPAKKKKHETVIDSILKEYKQTNATIIEERNHVRKVDHEMLKIEQERNDILKEFVTNAKTFQENVTKMLQKMK